jgi:hypothetical protein
LRHLVIDANVSKPILAFYLLFLLLFLSRGLRVGASEEGELHLVVDASVSKPIQCLLSFYIIVFSFKRLVRGHCPGMVTSGGNVIHKHFTEMRRLARDETPFLLDMPPRATTLAW